MKKIKILYNSNPNNPKNLNHLGMRSQMIEQDSKEFDSIDKAINFWMECTWPITELSDIDHREWVKAFNNIQVNAGYEEAEKFFRNQKELYNIKE